MRKLFNLVVARWLARTPVGLIALGIGWFLARRRRRNRAAGHDQASGRTPAGRTPAGRRDRTRRERRRAVSSAR
ncbi:DUF6203 family protein [Nonomuraea zeae]|uniref:Uncharacterized protein n=1 Tax=Nonomuraea zeae TaxID=1642303 RepID=A0A5S4FR23_9ACTN|nr:DUF6203 family protein [Nonomuraea zeae]TMR23142.1 hypothetical protein ETD85_48365 [Nonomuraea zeae]